MKLLHMNTQIKEHKMFVISYQLKKVCLQKIKQYWSVLNGPKQTTDLATPTNDHVQKRH